VQKNLSSTSTTADNKPNGREILCIALPLRKVNQNSKGSENLLLKEKKTAFVYGYGE